VAIQFANDQEPVDGTACRSHGSGVIARARDHLPELLAAYLKLQEVNRQKTVFWVGRA